MFFLQIKTVSLKKIFYLEIFELNNSKNTLEKQLSENIAHQNFVFSACFLFFLLSRATASFSSVVFIKPW